MAFSTCSSSWPIKPRTGRSSLGKGDMIGKPSRHDDLILTNDKLKVVEILDGVGQRLHILVAELHRAQVRGRFVLYGVTRVSLVATSQVASRRRTSELDVVHGLCHAVTVEHLAQRQRARDNLFKG